MIAIDCIAKRMQANAPPLFADVSLQLEAGQCIAIMGESGVGKSTLLNCIAGLESINAGTIRINGETLSTHNDDSLSLIRRRLFGFVFQSFHILPHLTLAQNVAVPLWLLDITGQEAAGRARKMLARVGLSERADDWPRHLSGGQLQRVAIARALVHHPAVILADEPTGNLDAKAAAQILDLLLDNVKNMHTACILVTHSSAAAQRMDVVLRLEPDGLYPLIPGV